MARKGTRAPRDATVRTRTDGTKRTEPARATNERVTFQLPVSLIERGLNAGFLLARSHFVDLHGRGLRCSVEAGGEEARQAVSVACGRRSPDRNVDKDRPERT